MSVGELAERWGVSIDTVYKLIRQGRLRAINVGLGTLRPRYRIAISDVRANEAERGIVS